MAGETMSADGQISAAGVAVLAERVDRVLINYDELRGLILSQNAQLSQVPLIAQTLNETNAKLDRVFSTLKTNDARIAALERSDYNNKFILRLGGAVLLASVSLIGWGWHQAVQLYNADAALDRRALIMEYKLGITTANAEGAK